MELNFFQNNNKIIILLQKYFDPIVDESGSKSVSHSLQSSQFSQAQTKQYYMNLFLHDLFA